MWRGEGGGYHMTDTIVSVGERERGGDWEEKVGEYEVNVNTEGSKCEKGVWGYGVG